MASLASILPAAATATLTAALVMPVREGRRDKSVTSSARAPLVPVFPGAQSKRSENEEDGAPADTEESRSFAELVDAAMSALDRSTVAVNEPRLTTSDDSASDPSVVDGLSRVPEELQRPPLSKRAGLFLKRLLAFPPLSKSWPARVPVEPMQTVPVDRPLQPAVSQEADCEPSPELPGDADETSQERLPPLASEPPHDEAMSSYETGPFAEAPRSSASSLQIPQRLVPFPTERAVPITRRRLRAPASETTWPGMLVPKRSFGDESQRRAYLTGLCATAGPLDVALLEIAYTEEPPPYRIVVLRALLRIASPSSAETFVNALRYGEEEERMHALEGLIAIGRFDELPHAFSDPCEPIAAKAALRYFGSREREAFESGLRDYVDPVRCSRILTLLAGVLS